MARAPEAVFCAIVEANLFMKLKNSFLSLTLALAAMGGASGIAHPAPISITTFGSTFTQDFDGLARTGNATQTFTSLPAGVIFNETGSAANNSYFVGNGNGSQGNTYSFGATNATDRAFGTLGSGNNNSTLGSSVGLSFTNSTGVAITSVSVSYTGEQYRLGTPNRPDRLDFQYTRAGSSNESAFTTATYTNLDSLDFISPVTTGTAGTAVTGSTVFNPVTISNLNIGSGEVFFFRFTDFFPGTNQDGLAIDNFTLTATSTAAVPEPSTIALFSFGLASLGAMRRRKKQAESGDSSEPI